MTDESKIKILRRLLDEYEKDQTGGDEKRDSMIAMGRAMMNLVMVSGGQKGRTKIMDSIHDAMMSIMTIHPMDINKMIIADLANEHAMRDLMYDTIGSIIDTDDIPPDIKERLDAVGDVRDKLRVDGIRRLQAFLKVRPILIQAFRDLSVDVSGIPGALEDAAYEKAVTRQSGEKKN